MSSGQPNVRRFVSGRLSQIVRAVAFGLQGEMIKSISGGPKSGRIYGGEVSFVARTNGRGGHGPFPVAFQSRRAVHQASAPGEAPATDLGGLVGSIQVDDSQARGTNPRAVTNVGAAYAAALEDGTATIAPRPFARPAIEAVKRDLPAILGGTIRIGGDS